MTSTTTVTLDPGISQARQRYGMLLTALRLEADRTERATILTAMAELARTLALRTRGVIPQDDMTNGDTLAWEDTSSLLFRLSLAERGANADMESDGDPATDIDDYDECMAWDQLKSSVTSGEHLEATRTVCDFLLAVPADAELTEKYGPLRIDNHLLRTPGTPRARQFAVARFVDAAAACRAQYPETYPTEADYLARHAAPAGN